MITTDNEPDNVFDLVSDGPKPVTVTRVVIDGRELHPAEYYLDEDGRLVILTEQSPGQSSAETVIHYERND